MKYQPIRSLSLILIPFLFIFSFAADYTLAPGDTLEINIVAKPEMSTRQTIAPDGAISVPLIGRVTADGQTMPQLEATLKKEFAKYFEKPQFAVFLTPRPIYVVQNDVRKQSWEVKEAKSVAEARAYMGGTSASLNYGDVVTVNIGKAPDFWEDNWYKVLSAVGVAAGVWNVLR